MKRHITRAGPPGTGFLRTASQVCSLVQMRERVPDLSSTVESQLQDAIRDRYVLGAVIGEGGMATVYRAQDIRHHRSVALKVLKPELGALLGAERFLSEIRVTANLQHPHLLPLFDSGEADGLLYYVMPLVEGESLRARLDRERQLPVGDAVRIAIAVAGALDYAHRHGVIHRDLKPENILLHDGEPLVADFGIALAVSRAGGERATQTGMSLGTPQYMSPEQASAERNIDGRSDIYALGAVLYEMLAGEPPHTGHTMQAVIARVMAETPRALRSTRASIPEHVAAAAERALAKLPADRFDTAQQFALALAAGPVNVASGGYAPSRGPAAATRRALPSLLALGAIAIAVASAAGAWLWTRRAAPAEGQVARLMMKALPDAVEPSVITPDGRNLVYVGMSKGRRMIFVRPIDNLNAQTLPGTEDALRPFVSPDGVWIGYFTTDDKLRKVALAGGAPKVIGPAFRLGSASWGSGDGGVIVTNLSLLGTLTWINDAGGTMHPLTALDTSRHETGHFAPMVMPDGRSVVFGIDAQARGTASVAGEMAVVSIDEAMHGTAKHVPLGIRLRRAVGFTAPWLVYAGEDATTLMAVRFDPHARRIDGAPVVVLQDPAGVVGAQYAANGTLVYSHKVSSDNEAMLVDAATGAAKPMFDAMAHGPYMNPRLSPDGRRLLIQGTSPQGSDVWLHDLATHASTRLTNSGNAFSPGWSSDGKRVFFVAMGSAGAEMMWMPADGSAAPVRLFGAPQILLSEGPTPDGRSLVFQRQVNNVWSIWQADFAGDRAVHAVVSETFDNYMPALSPDGRWLAYVSTSAGAHEIYVRPYPGPGAPVQVSEGGGTEPAWARDGHRLLYRSGNGVFAATIVESPSFSVGARRLLFRHTYEGEMPHANFVELPDGHLVMIGAPAGVEPDMVVVVNWISELRRRMR